MALLLIGVMAAIGAVQVIGPFLALTASQTAAKSEFQVFLKVPGVELFLGNFLNPAFTATMARNLIIAFLGRSGLLIILLFGLSLRWRPVYYTALLLLILDIAWNVGLIFLGYLGVLGGGLNAFLAVFSLTLLSASDRDFAVIMERLWTKPDSKARSAADFYRRGVAYRQDGMWALAVAQWRRAVGLAPTAVAYYKELGIGYAQIGHFDRSLRVLEEAQRQAPEDAQIPQMIQIVREQVAQQAQPAGPA
jgi:tetratricopeptide (TPR) repeat protein